MLNQEQLSTIRWKFSYPQAQGTPNNIEPGTIRHHRTESQLAIAQGIPNDVEPGTIEHYKMESQLAPSSRNPQQH